MSFASPTPSSLSTSTFTSTSDTSSPLSSVNSSTSLKSTILRQTQYSPSVDQSDSSSSARATMAGTPTPGGGTPGGTPAGTPVATPASTVVVSESAFATTVSATDGSSGDSTMVVSQQNPTVIVQTVSPSNDSPSVILQTSFVTAPDRSRGPSSGPVVVYSTAYSSTQTGEPEPTSRAGHATSTSSAPASLNTGGGGGGDKNGGGLGTGATVAIAVVVPVVSVALIVLGIIFWWRKRKQRKTAEDARRKEVEEYGYNPNNDPTLPAVGGTAGSDSPEMEDTGYRGWGNNNPVSPSARKPSTNMSSNIGMAVSDHSPGSPGHPTMSDGSHSGEPLVDGHDAYDGMGAAGGATAANSAAYKNKNPPAELGANGMKRGPSNASSSYSAAGHTDTSDDATGPDHGYDTNYSQFTPYRQGTGNTFDDSAQPVIRDVDARRNTKIENPSVLPKQGNSGIAANF